MEDRVINNIDELIQEMGYKNEFELQKSLYKYSDCGLAFAYTEKGVCVTGYVESDYDYCGESRSLLFPFKMSEFNKALDDMDECGSRIWYVLNKDDGYEDIDDDIMWEIVSSIACEYDHDDQFFGSPIFR